MNDTNHAAEIAHGAAHEHVVGHVVPFPVLLAVFLALGLLTFATVAATWVNLGPANLWIAMAIAVVKASLVVLYFMHLRYDHPFNGLIFVVGLLMLALFVGITLLDTYQYQPDIVNW
jgi:cytochrome c oxidase subunit 4